MRVERDFTGDLIDLMAALLPSRRLEGLPNHLIDWCPNEPMIDLTCGSGTTLIEARIAGSNESRQCSALNSRGLCIQALEKPCQT